MIALSKRRRRSTTDDATPRESSKRRQAQDDDDENHLRHEDYTVGWIAALWIELAAAQSMLDDVHETLPSRDDDSNTYVLGRIADHNIVIACLPAGHYGNNNAAIVASNMRRTFPSINRVLMVGVGGGVPDSNDVRLGDVVVSLEVQQCDFGKAVCGGQFQHTGVPIRPPQKLLTAIAKLRASHALVPSQVPSILSKMTSRYPSMTKFSRPNAEDRLFRATYSHRLGASSCENCDHAEVIERDPRPDTNPRIHYGRIASANQVIKDGVLRSQFAEKLDVLCFDMEAAGCMDSYPGLVIRGICDYSDSHKNKQWQEYAAATAAAYAKELLAMMPVGYSTLNTAPSEFSDATSLLKTEAEIRRDSLKSLQFEHIDFRRSAIDTAHAKTCEWILDHPSYMAWQDPEKYRQHHGFIWISGKPGVGKSTLMKFMVSKEHGLSHRESKVISFFFNARGAELERSAFGMYRSLLFQLLSSWPDLQHVLQGRTLWTSIEELQSLLARAVTNLGTRRLTCYIDALDECDEDEVLILVDFFESLGQLASEENIRLYVCFSSRHYPYIEIQNGLRFALEDQPGHKQDIVDFIQSRLRTGNEKTTKKVTEQILQKASGVFMWVVLVVNILNKEFRRGRIFAVKQRLQELPDRLSELFQDIISRDTENVEETLLCIQWILYASVPLTCEELYFAVNSGLEPSLREQGPWDEDKCSVKYMERFLLNSSKGLAEVEELGNRVQFIHESVRDFLLKDDGIRHLWPGRVEEFQAWSHERLKKCCEAYMMVDLSSSYSIIPEWNLGAFNYAREVRQCFSAFPFLQHATMNVLYHADEAAYGGIAQTTFLANFDLKRWASLAKIFMLKVPATEEEANERFQGGNPCLTYVLTEHKYFSLLEDVIKNGPPPKGSSSTDEYTYPLIVASALGSSAAVDLLLKSESTDVNCRDKNGATALYYASMYGCIDVVKVLLAHSAINVSQGYMDPLVIAARSGRFDVVDLVLDSEIPGLDVKLALDSAAEKEHYAIVDLIKKKRPLTQVSNCQKRS